jgi:hypothetical protein
LVHIEYLPVNPHHHYLGKRVMEAIKSALKFKSKSTNRSKSQSKKMPLAVERDEKLLRLEAARRKFQKLLPELLKAHEGKYVAVINGFIEIHQDKQTLLKTVIEKYGYHTMYLSLITKEEKVVRMRSPRIVSRS